MPEPTPDSFVARRPDQLAALTSPVRMELLEQVGLAGRASVQEVAERMGRAPESLYYHVRKLAAAGLLVRAGTRGEGTSREAVYTLPAKVIEVPRRAKGSKGRAVLHKAVDAVLRLAGRELKDALEDDDVIDEGARRALYGRRLGARLSIAELAELNHHVREIEELFAVAAAKGRRRGRPLAMTIVMAPMKGREER